MKNFMTSIVLILLLVTTGTAQDAGQMWLHRYQPGHSITEELNPDSLAKLDLLMCELPEDATIWFYGAATTQKWKGTNTHVSTALDGGVRISRALELSRRYPYRQINVSATHENITGVKVVWYLPVPAIISNDTTYNITSNQVLNIDNSIDNGTEIRIPVGVSAQLIGSDGFAIPYIGAYVENGKWLYGGKIGALPFTFENSYSNSFVNGCAQYMFTPSHGISADIFVTWEYLTAVDKWTKKSAGLSAGYVFKLNKAELGINGLIANQVVYDQPGSTWKTGATATLSYYIK